MGTIVRTKVSSSNKWFVEKDRYLELLHFCRQYETWKRKLNNLSNLRAICSDDEPKSGEPGDPTANIAIACSKYTAKIDMVESAALEADEYIGKFILKGIIDDLSFDKLNAKYEIGCCKDTYYDRYRKFFYILDKKRD